MRDIEHTITLNKYGYRVRDESDDRNNILQKALTRYVAKLEPELDFRTGGCSLTVQNGKGLAGVSEQSDSDDDDDDDPSERGSVAGQLGRLKVNTNPPLGEWVTLVRSPERIEFKETRSSKTSSGGRRGAAASADAPGAGRTSLTVCHSLRCRAPDAEAQVSKFVMGAYKWCVVLSRAPRPTVCASRASCWCAAPRVYEARVVLLPAVSAPPPFQSLFVLVLIFVPPAQGACDVNHPPGGRF